MHSRVFWRSRNLKSKVNIVYVYLSQLFRADGGVYTRGGSRASNGEGGVLS